VESSSLSRTPSGDFLTDAPYRTRGASGRLLVRYGRLLGPLLGGYMLLDKAFAYIHLPGTPLYVGELVLTVGGLGVLSATGYLRIPVRDEPILALLAAFCLWGFIRFLPGFRTYGLWAVRDFALVYYSLFAFFTVAALARAPELVDRWLAQLARFVPWLLIWLPFGLILSPKPHAPSVPFSGGVSILTHEAGNAAIAALIGLGSMWLFPETRKARTRAVLSVLALVTVALSATQNRAGLLGFAAGAAIGLAFLPSRDRLRLLVRAVATIVIGLTLAVQFSIKIPATNQAQGREFTASQLIENVVSIGGGAGTNRLNGTVAARDQLWSLIFQAQRADGKLVYGFGFGLNLPYLVGDTQVTSGSDPLRSPHNSHDDILARMGLIGIVLWIALWLAWYWRMVTGCLRLARLGLDTRRKVAALCLMVVTAILVSCYFSPQLEGAQVAVLFWTAVGVGVAVTSFRGLLGRHTLASAAAKSPSSSRAEPRGTQVPPPAENAGAGDRGPTISSAPAQPVTGAVPTTGGSCRLR
jgi:O-antigen ligase